MRNPGTHPKAFVSEKGAARMEAGHPWVFRSDVTEVTDAEAGDVVSVFCGKKFLGQAFYSPRSQITLRRITQGKEPVDRAFWRRRIEEAIGRRADLPGEARRLVFGESDLTPSLLVDRYRDVVVLQTLSAGAERIKETVIGTLEELLAPAAIVERNDVAVREKEGLPSVKAVVRGALPERIEVREGDRSFLVDPIEGQKTGLYLDQAENRLAARRYARGRLLDLFCYQGGFAIQSADRAGEVTAVDGSAAALRILEKNCERNGIRNVSPAEGNAFDLLREFQRRGETFDTILADPPPFVKSRSELAAARRGYKEINLRAIQCLKPGGLLVTSSCSQNFTPPMFLEMLWEAARDARREIQVLEQRGAAPDHPVLLTFPESSYLQCWFLRVL